MTFNYGDAYKRYPCQSGTICFENGSKVKVHDIFDTLPVFMKKADILFTDSPWNTGNLTSFYTKADMAKRAEFDAFMTRLFECVDDINPNVCYLEIGKEHLADYVMNMRRLFKHVTLYNSSYYHKQENICYVVRGWNRGKAPKLDYLDEEDIIEKICADEQYECIGDLCMGRGLVGINAYRNCHRFVGTELNHKRLSVLIENIVEAGGAYTVE